VAVAEIGKLGNAAGKANRDLKSLGDRGIDSGKRIDGAMGKARTSLHGLGIAAAGIGIVGGAALAGFAKSIISIGVEFQTQLNTLQAVTHATAATMQQVGKRARDLGNDLSLPATSAADAAQAMTELAKGNLTAQQAMDAAKGTLLLAAAAQVDGATAAQIQANALNAFSLKASDAGHVADVLANAANSATGEIGDFAHGLQASSAVAAQFHISLDDTVTALALFANKGIQGSDAGTSLKASLLALASPSLQAKKALRQLHLEAFDAKGNFVGLASISEQLAKAQGHLSQQAFAAAVSTAFGSDAARAAGVFAASGADGFNQMSAAIGRAGGAAAVAKAQMKGVGDAIQGLQSQIETVKIDIFQREAPHLESFIRLLSDKLPGAADSALKGIDRLTSTIETGMPRARAEFETIAPLVGNYFRDKIKVAGDAVTNVLTPALHGLETITARLAPELLQAGDAANSVFRAGVDAAGKAAHAFNSDANDLGTGLANAGQSIGKVAHDLLPALTGSLHLAGGAAAVLVSGVAGAASILSPFAGSAVAAAVAIKGIQLASAGVGKAEGAIGKVTGAWDKLSTRVVNAAGAIQSSVTFALGSNLNTAAAAAESTMAKTASTMKLLGVVGAASAVSVGLIGIALENDKKAAQENTDAFRLLFDGTRQGGQAALDAQDALNHFGSAISALSAKGGPAAAVAQKFGNEMGTAGQQSETAASHMSALDAAQAAVTKSQNDYTLAATSFGPASQDAVNALAVYRGALANQKGIQDLVNQATQNGTQTLAEYTTALSTAAEVDNARVQQELGVKQGALSLRQAQDAVTAAVSRYGPVSAQATQATLTLQTQQAALKGQILAAAAAAGSAAQQQSKAATETGRAAAGATAYRAELGKLVGTLAPGSPLRVELQGLIQKLDAAARDRTAHLQIVTSEVDIGASHRRTAVPNIRAAGGPVTKGEPYIVGEKGPELLVPDQSGYIYPGAPRGGSAGRAGGFGGAPTYNVTVNAGLGAPHPADIGAGVVQAIREFEKRSGAGWRAA
jgi:TP901 family phage tail tape measure protein